MEAKELMIGNYVKDPYGKIIKIVSVEKDASMLKPIPLTEDWLLKFGFERRNKTYSLNVSRESFTMYYIESINFNIWYHEEKGYCLNEIWQKPQHFITEVHQLQNLYFALTGEEFKQPAPSKTLEQ